jgi:hypothetical protein
MYEFDKGRMSAMRHMMTPSVGFSYTPNLRSMIPDYYRKIYNIETGDTYVNSSGKEIEYTIFEGSKYGTPSAPGQSGNITLALRNNLEAKIFAKDDTTGKAEKVSILDNFDFSTSYNPFSETYKWSNVNMSSRTSIFNKKVSLQVNGTLDPYALGLDTLSNTYKKTTDFEYSSTGKLFRLTNLTGSVGMSFRSQQGGKSDDRGDNLTPDGSVIDDEYLARSGGYGTLNPPIDFDIPWSVRVNYNFRYSKPTTESTITQTMRLSGDFSLTPKWKITSSSGYDFKMKEITATSLTISRDLHCWEMSLSTVPFGDFTYFDFRINVKSSILQDLKYDKRWDKRYDD